MGLELKKCTAADVLELQQLSIQTFTETFKDQNNEENLNAYLDEAYEVGKLVRELNHPASFFYFLKEDNETVGYLKLNINEAQSESDYGDALEVERIYIKACHKRKGYGKYLIQESEKMAQFFKKKSMWLGVWEFNDKAQAFYHKMGFNRIGQHVFYMGKEKQTDYIFGKNLD